jgi:hypothetical protein
MSDSSPTVVDAYQALGHAEDAREASVKEEELTEQKWMVRASSRDLDTRVNPSPANSASPTPKAETADSPADAELKRPPSTPSMETTPAPAPPKRKGPQLIEDLPIARPEAMATFVELPGNHYQYSTLGRSREAMEGMVCDCTYSHGGYSTI